MRARYLISAFLIIYSGFVLVDNKEIAQIGINSRVSYGCQSWFPQSALAFIPFIKSPPYLRVDEVTNYTHLVDKYTISHFSAKDDLSENGFIFLLEQERAILVSKRTIESFPYTEALKDSSNEGFINSLVANRAKAARTQRWLFTRTSTGSKAVALPRTKNKQLENYIFLCTDDQGCIAQEKIRYGTHIQKLSEVPDIVSQLKKEGYALSRLEKENLLFLCKVVRTGRINERVQNAVRSFTEDCKLQIEVLSQEKQVEFCDFIQNKFIPELEQLDLVEK